MANLFHIALLPQTLCVYVKTHFGIRKTHSSHRSSEQWRIKERVAGVATTFVGKCHQQMSFLPFLWLHPLFRTKWWTVRKDARKTANPSPFQILLHPSMVKVAKLVSVLNFLHIRISVLNTGVFDELIGACGSFDGKIWPITNVWLSNKPTYRQTLDNDSY